jgi:hypothetical protein
MGMFDWLRCEAELPDGFQFHGKFQTKDLDSLMNTYAIRADGTLWMTEKADIWDIGENDNFIPRFDNFSGDVIFYGSNLTSTGPEGYTTENDEPYWSRDYQGIFNEGHLLIPIKLLGSKNDYPWNKKHLTSAESRAIFRKKYGFDVP